MNASDVADYLKQHPEFFEEYADLLADISCSASARRPRDPDRRASDRHAAREERRAGGQVREMIQFGGENDSISEKLHRSTLALVCGAAISKPRWPCSITASRMISACRRSLAARGARCPEHSYLPELAATSQELRDYADALGRPVIAEHRRPSIARIGSTDAPPLTSFAFLPLRTHQTFGLLALGADDPARFHAGMGTMYLTRLAELASVATARFLPQG